MCVVLLLISTWRQGLGKACVCLVSLLISTWRQGLGKACVCLVSLLISTTILWFARCASEHRNTHKYSLLHLECYFVIISSLNRIGLFSTERGKRDLEN